MEPEAGRYPDGLGGIVTGMDAGYFGSRGVSTPDYSGRPGRWLDRHRATLQKATAKAIGYPLVRWSNDRPGFTPMAIRSNTSLNRRGLSRAHLAWMGLVADRRRRHHKPCGGRLGCIWAITFIKRYCELIEQK